MATAPIQSEFSKPCAHMPPATFSAANPSDSDPPGIRRRLTEHLVKLSRVYASESARVADSIVDRPIGVRIGELMSSHGGPYQMPCPVNSFSSVPVPREKTGT